MANEEDTSCGQRLSARCTAFGKFLYNSDEGKIIGRTPKSWLLITIFFIIYYSLLAAFFIGMLSVLLYGVIEVKTPRLTGDHSLLRMNPGLAMRPQPDVEKTLIAYNIKQKDYGKYVDNMNKVVGEYTAYKDMSDSGVTYEAKCNLSDAQFNKDFQPKKKICVIDPNKDWGNCTKANKFGYEEGKPCVIVKMNRVFGWMPDIQNKNKSMHALLECTGENDGDKPNIGQVDYYPSTIVDGKRYGYFSSALFPYLNQPGFSSPSVAVKFSGIRQNVMVMVHCRLSNLINSEYDKLDRLAMVRFEVAVFNHA